MAAFCPRSSFRPGCSGAPILIAFYRTREQQRELTSSAGGAHSAVADPVGEHVSASPAAQSDARDGGEPRRWMGNNRLLSPCAARGPRLSQACHLHGHQPLRHVGELWAKKLLRSITFFEGLFYFRVMTATALVRVRVRVIRLDLRILGTGPCNNGRSLA